MQYIYYYLSSDSVYYNKIILSRVNAVHYNYCDIWVTYLCKVTALFPDLSTHHKICLSELNNGLHSWLLLLRGLNFVLVKLASERQSTQYIGRSVWTVQYRPTRCTWTVMYRQLTNTVRRGYNKKWLSSKLKFNLGWYGCTGIRIMSKASSIATGRPG